MTGNLSGADTEGLDALARQFTTSSERLRQLGNEVVSQVHRSPWSGGDAQRFQQEYSSVHLPRVIAAAVALERMARSLSANAAEQRGASTADGASVSAASIGGAAASAGLFGRILGDDPTLDRNGLRISHSWLNDRQGIGADVDRSVTVNGVDYDASAGVFLGTKESVRTAFDVGPDGLYAGATAGFQAGLEADARVAATAGIASASAAAHLFTGTRASGDIHAKVGPEGVDLSAKAGAMAGVEASGTLGADVGGVGGSVTGSFVAGAGAEFGGDVKVTADEIDVSFEIGAALGIGFEVEPHFTIHPQEVLTNIGHLFN